MEKFLCCQLQVGLELTTANLGSTSRCNDAAFNKWPLEI
jgi:hypothetical protein